VTLTFPATATGVVQYIRAKRIRATGTTATVLACY
jgi:nanoRNase/pAp phosphatase (c-di-AMP/oligoRNAs hydrolase)